MGWRRSTVSGHESLEGQGSPEGQGSRMPGPRRPSWKAWPAAPAGPLGRAGIPPGARLPAARPPARAYRWSLPCPSAKNHLFQAIRQQAPARLRWKAGDFSPVLSAWTHLQQGHRTGLPSMAAAATGASRGLQLVASGDNHRSPTPPPTPLFSGFLLLAHLWVTASPAIRLSDLPKTFITKSLHQRAPIRLHRPRLKQPPLSSSALIVPYLRPAQMTQLPYQDSPWGCLLLPVPI